MFTNENTRLFIMHEVSDNVSPTVFGQIHSDIYVLYIYNICIGLYKAGHFVLHWLFYFFVNKTSWPTLPLFPLIPYSAILGQTAPSAGELVQQDYHFRSILTPPIVIPSIRATYGFWYVPKKSSNKKNVLIKKNLFINPQKWQQKWENIPIVLLRIYSSRKKSWARESPAFPASVTAVKIFFAFQCQCQICLTALSMHGSI